MKVRSAILAAGLAVWLMPSAAGAATYSQSLVFPPLTLNSFTTTSAQSSGGSLAQFNPALGTLNAIDYDLRFSLSCIAVISCSYVVTTSLDAAGIHDSVDTSVNNSALASGSLSGAILNTAGFVGTGLYNPVASLVIQTGNVSVTETFSPTSTLTYVYTPAIPSLGAVPLPPAAPMFGAALLALGAIGFGLRRKQAAGV